MQATIEVGTSGYAYNHWRPCFYPEGLARSRWLPYYSDHFTTVELNNTFYRLPSESVVDGWRDATPERFVFAVKASRFITHVKRLKDCVEPVATFLERAQGLQKKLGPVLYQLPPTMARNDERLSAFLEDLPSGFRHVFEFRHRSWLDEEVFDLLRTHQAGFCVFDMPGLRCPVEVTGDFAYFRFHGPEDCYGGSYTDRNLASWAERIGALAETLRTIYVYFNNDSEGRAVENARSLLRFLGG